MFFDHQSSLFRRLRFVRLCHVSEAASPLRAEDLLEIGVAAYQRHRRSAVTGFLLYLDGAILQVLEGEEPAVERSLAAFRADARIGDATPLLRERPYFRQFRDWSLGALDLPFEALPANVFFKAEWSEIRRRVRAIGRPGFYRILERFYEVNHCVEEREPAPERCRSACGG